RIRSFCSSARMPSRTRRTPRSVLKLITARQFRTCSVLHQRRSKRTISLSIRRPTIKPPAAIQHAKLIADKRALSFAFLLRQSLRESFRRYYHQERGEKYCRRDSIGGMGG